MTRKAAMLTTSFACGVLVALLVHGGFDSRAFAQGKQGNDLAKRVQALEARLASLEAQQKSSSAPNLRPIAEQPPQQQGSNPNPHLQPIKEETWQEQVNQRLSQLEQEARSQSGQLSKLSSLPDALAKLQFRFDNHYHNLLVPGHTPMAIEPILNCPGYIGGTCTAASGDKFIVVPVVKGNATAGGFEQTSQPKVDVNPANQQ